MAAVRPPHADAPARPLDGLLRRRLLLVTGKGGTGKTTLAAALARAAAGRGIRVLACELGRDPRAPASLLEALAPGAAPSLEPQPLGGTLQHALLSPEHGYQNFLRDVLPFRFLAERALRVEALQRFLAAGPAFAEMGVLYRGLQLLRAQRRDGSALHELIVMDAPASGHALGFANLPDTVIGMMPVGPIGKAAKEGRAVLTDPARTAAIVTSLPEPLPVSEALELVRGLERSRMHVAAVVANQLPRDPFSAAERLALETVLPRQGVLGRRSLARLAQAEVARERLHLGQRAPVLEVPELGQRGEVLVEAVREALEHNP